jgi:polyisoprenoid-binding protein YceI
MIPDTTAIAFEATAEVDRRDFNVSFNGALENGSLVVGNKVKIEIEIEASKAN